MLLKANVVFTLMFDSYVFENREEAPSFVAEDA